MVYVINFEGKPLMPTTNAKARKLLKQKKATVKRVNPFIIQLLYKTDTEYIQTITLGIDSGYLNIGFSAITDSKELIVGEVKLLQGMKDRLLEKSQYRRIRRQRLRYRKPRWNNRKIKQGWLAPSLQHKLNTHLKFIDYLNSILPIRNIVIEVANFDIQKIKNPDISGVEYQQGEQMGFWNVREYVLHRDGHKCQNPNCKNKSKEQILEIHHIKYKSEGGSDAPSNLITLCNKCHTSPNHKKGKFLYDWCENGKKVRGFRDATFMSMIRWYLLEQLKEKYTNIKATYGYLTKNHRIEHGIEKSHFNDAFAIAKGVNQVRNLEIFKVEQSRLNNRSLEKFYDAKYIDNRTGEKVSASELNCGRRTRNKNLNSENLRVFRGQKISKGQRRIRKQKSLYQPNDLIKYDGNVYTVKGSQNEGKYIALKEIKKVPNVKLIKPYIFKKGLNWSHGLY
ncbi:RNA-guided endonuclease IscB [Clostridioides sp. ZZV14-6153]|uniref:RNA-guided endonuclease IscB n=3 Tax=unclassified Clostridioides TaxID=2635829 RepID=UPI001D12B332|nr:HNH endonuclease [Clostridioides sp. ZZV14-6153]